MTKWKCATATNSEGIASTFIDLNQVCNTDVVKKTIIIDNLRSFKIKVLNIINNVRTQSELNQLEEIQLFTEITREISAGMINKYYL